VLNRISDSVVRYPWLYIAAFIVATVFFAAQTPRIEVDATIESMLPEDLPTRKNLNKIEDLFGGTDMMIVVISTDDILQPATLKRVKKLSNRMQGLKEIDAVVSPFTIMDVETEGDVLILHPAVRRIPSSNEQRENLRQKIRENENVYGVFISKNFRHVAVAGFQSKDATDEVVLEKVQELIRQVPGKERVILGGTTFSREMLGRDIKKDLGKFVPIGFGVTLIFLFVCFRQLRGVLLPTIVTVMSIIVTMGLIPIFGWKIQMVTIILPVFMIAVANNYGIHVLSRYQEDNLAGTERSSRELAKMGIQAMTAPIVLTGITTAVGVLCLHAHVIVSAQQMGTLAACGVLFALLGSLLFIPAVLAVIPRSKSMYVNPNREGEQAFTLVRVLQWAALAATRHPRAILITTGLLIVPIALGIKFIVVENSPVSYYASNSPVVISTNLIDKQLGGSLGISVIAEGDIKSPAVMKKIDALEKHMESIPHVEYVMSIAKVVKQINQALNDKNKEFYSIPDSREVIAQYLLLYGMAGNPTDLDKLVDFPYKHAHIFTRVNGNKSALSKEVIEDLENYIRNEKDTPFTTIGGFGELVSELSDYVIRGQFMSLVLAMVLVGILVMMLFGSFVAGLIALIPLGLAMLFLFGLMGYLGIELNIATAMLSSIMIGVGVDYTIHFLWRYRVERRKGVSAIDAVKITLTTSGRGIVFNALSVMVGFAVLILSTFLPVRFFGILVVICISACLLGALIVLPVICLVVRPRFLEPVQDP